MKKVILFIIFVLIGATAVYFSLDKINSSIPKEKETTESKKVNDKKENKEESVKSTKDDFVMQANRLQVLAEQKNGDITCKCYNIKELDSSSKLTGSILVHTIDDLYVSTMWISNGYYMLDGVENAAVGIVDDTNEDASIYCGEDSAEAVSSLCS